MATFEPKPKPPKPRAWGSKRSHSKHIRNDSDQLAWNRGYRFVPALVDHFLAFCEDNLVFVRGSKTGQPVVWLDFQIQEIIGPILGWVHKDTFLRRIRRAYVELTKKQGKTTLAAALCLYFMLSDFEGGANIYSNGPTMFQAGLAWDIAADMLDYEGTTLAACHFEIDRRFKLMRSPGQQSMWKALAHTSSSKRGTAQGVDASFTLNDELHEWPGYDHWKQVTRAGRARSQPCMLSITNAGKQKTGPCWDEHEYACKVLNSEIMDLRFHGFVRQTDEAAAEAEIDAVADGSLDISVAKQANPAIGLIVDEDEILRDVREATTTPGEKGNVLRLTYSVWREFGDDPWLADKWDGCGAAFSYQDLAGWPCWFGLDVAAVKDFTSLAMLFEIEPRERYRLLVHFWISQARMRELIRIDPRFEQWAASPFVHINPGETTSHSDVRDDVTNLVQSCSWKAGNHTYLPQIIYDPRMADVIVTDVSDATGCEVVEFRQTAENYHAPCEKLEGLIGDRKLEHDGNQLLAFQAANVGVKQNSAEHKRPIRVTPEGGPGRDDSHLTIDGIVALLMALSQSDRPLPRQLDFYETNEVELI